MSCRILVGRGQRVKRILLIWKSCFLRLPAPVVAFDRSVAATAMDLIEWISSVEE